MTDKTTWNPPKKDETEDTLKRCPKCNLVLKKVMYYSCNQDDCPCFTQVRM